MPADAASFLSYITPLAYDAIDFAELSMPALRHISLSLRHQPAACFQRAFASCFHPAALASRA